MVSPYSLMSYFSICADMYRYYPLVHFMAVNTVCTSRLTRLCFIRLMITYDSGLPLHTYIRRIIMLDRTYSIYVCCEWPLCRSGL